MSTIDLDDYVLAIMRHLGHEASETELKGLTNLSDAALYRALGALEERGEVTLFRPFVGGSQWPVARLK